MSLGLYQYVHHSNLIPVILLGLVPSVSLYPDLPLISPMKMLFTDLSVSHSVVSDSLQPRGPQHARLLCPLDSPGKTSGVGFHFLLPGIFATEG